LDGRKLESEQGEIMAPASDARAYTLQISGTLDADFLASFCPPGTTMTFQEERVILSNLRTDQAGILGIIRSLHNLGCILLSLSVQL
jgi:hypothetical protein